MYNLGCYFWPTDPVATSSDRHDTCAQFFLVNNDYQTFPSLLKSAWFDVVDGLDELEFCDLTYSLVGDEQTAYCTRCMQVLLSTGSK